MSERKPGDPLKPATEGEWLFPQMSGYLLGCCDCGLVHRVDFAVILKTQNQETGDYTPVIQSDPDLGVILRAYREEEETRLGRKRKGLSIRKRTPRKSGPEVL